MEGFRCRTVLICNERWGSAPWRFSGGCKKVEIDVPQSSRQGRGSWVLSSSTIVKERQYQVVNKSVRCGVVSASTIEGIWLSVFRAAHEEEKA